MVFNGCSENLETTKIGIRRETICFRSTNLFSKQNSTPLWVFTSDGTDYIGMEIAMSLNSSYIVAGDVDGNLYLFEWPSSNPLFYRNIDDTHIYYLQISSNGNYISAISKHKLYFFTKNNLTLLWNYTFEGENFFPPLSMSSDGNYIVTGTEDGKIYLFHNEINGPTFTSKTRYILNGN